MGNKRGTKEKVTLGSGKLYMSEFTGDLEGNFADILEQIMKPENHAGWIKGGASIEYKPEMTTEKDDLGHVVKEILTEEEATFKTGLFTWNGETLSKFTATAEITVEKNKGKVYRRLKIGGTENDDGKQYAILFVHEDKIEGNCYLLVVGRNTAGFTIAFAPDSATVIDAEFTCKPHDERGTLIEFVEEIDPEYQETYTEAELNALTVSQIETIAKAKGYTLTGSTKAEVIASFLAAQAAAEGSTGGGDTGGSGETPGGGDEGDTGGDEGDTGGGEGIPGGGDEGDTGGGGETPGGGDGGDTGGSGETPGGGDEGEAGDYKDTYTEEELNALTVSQIETIAKAKGYTLAGNTKAEKITAFLVAQAEAGGTTGETEPGGEEQNSTE